MHRCHGCGKNTAPLPLALCASCGGNFYQMPKEAQDKLRQPMLCGRPVIVSENIDRPKLYDQEIVLDNLV